MKRIFFLLLLCLSLIGCTQVEAPQTLSTTPPTTVQTQPTEPVTVPTTAATEATLPTTQPTVPTTEETEPPIVVELTDEEQRLLKKLAMAELGQDQCTECLALVMCTVLNRVESDRFGSSVKGVIYAENQFTPVADGTFEDAIPDPRCDKALQMVMEGWDESEGALYYEFCEGESWHSQNLELLFQHCNTRFYK